jgi:hypothetical protein
MLTVLRTQKLMEKLEETIVCLPQGCVTMLYTVCPSLRSAAGCGGGEVAYYLSRSRQRP